MIIGLGGAERDYVDNESSLFREQGIWMAAGVCAVLSVTSCLAPTRSDMAHRINVCGQQYEAKKTVVTVEKQPQWLITKPHICVDHPVLSPQPQPRVETTKTQELDPI